MRHVVAILLGAPALIIGLAGIGAVAVHREETSEAF
jgi:hypothetical protein